MKPSDPLAEALETIARNNKILDMPSRFTDDRAEYEAAEKGPERSKRVVLTPALYLSRRVEPTSDEFRRLLQEIEQVNVLRPMLAYRQLRRLRQRYREVDGAYRELLADCLRRLGEPVEGALTTDIAWFQGFNFASGFAAIFELTQVHAAVSEGLDRKAAYSMACFALYVAVVSLTATVVLGLLSLG